MVAALLAVDLGVRTGLAAYGADGRVQWYRSRNFGSAARLRRAIPGMLDAEPGLRYLVIEGGGQLADIWQAETRTRSLQVDLVTAERWRELMLYPREQRSGEAAKRTALTLARRVIEWSGAKRPTSLTHDAAEAVLIGLWGALHVGLLTDLPAGLVHGTRRAHGTPIQSGGVVPSMCMSCGCGKPNERHNPGDIILDDLQRAAKNANIDVEQAADNIHNSAREVRGQGGQG